MWGVLKLLETLGAFPQPIPAGHNNFRHSRDVVYNNCSTDFAIAIAAVIALRFAGLARHKAHRPGGVRS